MWGSGVSLKHGLVLLFFEQQECETSTPGLVLSSPSLCVVTPGLSPSIHCSDSCSSPDVLGWPSSGILSMEGATHYLYQREHPMYKWVSSMTRSRSVNILLQVLNKCELQLFIYLFFTPSFFNVGCMYFWRACRVWRDYLNFSNWNYFQKNSFLSYFRLGFYSGHHVVLLTALNTYFRLMVIEVV